MISGEQTEAFLFPRHLISIRDMEENNMKKNSWILLIACLAFGVMVAFIYPTLKGEAQISPETQKVQDEALSIVKGQAISNTFYETLTDEERSMGMSWKLKSSRFNRQSFEEGVIRTMQVDEKYAMSFSSDKSKVDVFIDKYESPELASKSLNSLILSMGYIDSNKEFGDDGIKILDGKNGKLLGIRFRKNKFTISISCDSEAIARRFANYALKAIEGH